MILRFTYAASGQQLGKAVRRAHADEGTDLVLVLVGEKEVDTPQGRSRRQHHKVTNRAGVELPEPEVRRRVAPFVKYPEGVGYYWEPGFRFNRRTLAL